MKAFELEFNIKGIEDTIKIFSSLFVKTYRKKCIIIDNNKKIPLKEEFSINQKEKDNKQKKIKLIISNFRGDLKNGIIFKSYNKNDLKITERNILRKHFTNISISMNDMYKITYKINLNINQTKNSKDKIIEKNNNKIHEFKIFGHKFVQNNKDKCVIIYNNKLYPLKEYFPGWTNLSIPLFALISLLINPWVYLFATFNFKVFSEKEVDSQIEEVALKFICDNISLMDEEELVISIHIKLILKDFGDNNTPEIPDGFLHYILKLLKTQRDLVSNNKKYKLKIKEDKLKESEYLNQKFLREITDGVIKVNYAWSIKFKMTNII